MSQYNKKVFDKIYEQDVVGLKKFVKNTPTLEIDKCQSIHSYYGVQTPIDAAIRTGNLEMVKFLHSKGCSFRENSLLLALQTHSSNEILDFLIEQKVPTDDTLTWTIKEDKFETFTYLISQGVKEARLLETAIILDKPHFMNYILLKEIETIHVLNKVGENMLTLALMQDNFDCIEVLLNFGFDSNNFDKKVYDSTWHQEVMKEYMDFKKPYDEKKQLEKSIENPVLNKIKHKL